MVQRLSGTFDYAFVADYDKAVTTAKPSVWWLWYRDPETLKTALPDEKIGELISEIEKALLSDDWNVRKKIIKKVFVELWLALETWFSKSEIERIVDTLDNFTNDLIVPIEDLFENTHLFNESYWPTDAFKDIALQMLTEMTAIIVEGENCEQVARAKYLYKEYEDEQFNYKSILDWMEDNNLARPKIRVIVNLTSTSWDTWPAWGKWIEWKKFIVNIIWFPAFEATYSQIWQMLVLWDNVMAIPLDAQFSNIQEQMISWNTQEYQDKLKAIIEENLSELIEKYWFEIEVDSWSFNSINPWRIDGQTLYHTYWILQAKAKGILKEGDDYIHAIPSWNGGHMYSLLQAWLMWHFEWQTLVTCNENDMFYKIFEEWKFRMPPKDSKEIHQASVSMIIRYPNNMIRLFSYAFWEKRAKEISDDFFAGKEVVLSTKELSTLKDTLRVRVERVTTEDELRTVWETFKKTGRLICPHTANALTWLQRYRDKIDDHETQSIVSETASPWKFLAATAAALLCTRHEESDSFTNTCQIDSTIIDIDENTSYEYVYTQLRKFEKFQGWDNISTKEWIDGLIKIIEKQYSRLWYEFDMNIIPKDLRDLYENGYEMKEVKKVWEFHNEASSFVESYAKTIREQVESLF